MDSIAKFSRRKTGRRILFSYGGNRLCKGAVTDGAIVLQKKAPVIAPAFPQGF